MAATINGRQLGDALLRTLFHELDAGATRQRIRTIVREAQGRGVSNETVAALRKAHVQYRRSQGYAITARTRTKLRATPDSPLTPVSQLSTRIGAEVRRLSPSRRPNAPRIEGVRQTEIVQFETRIDGVPTGESEIRQFETGPGQPSLEEQLREAEEGGKYRSQPALPRGVRYRRLVVTLDIPGL